MAEDGSTGGWAAFRYRDFRYVFAGRILSATGTAMMQVAIGWEMWRITRDPLVLGLVGLALFLPNLVFFLPAGVIADRFPRRLVLMASYGLQAAASLLLLLVFASAEPNVAVVLAVIFFVGAGRTFAAPASQALVANVVPSQHFPNAVAWTSATWELAVIIGPMMGGFLLETGSTVVFASVSAAYILNTVMMAMLHTRVQVISREPVSLTSLVAGLAYIWRRKIILGATSLDLFAVLLGGATALLPIYATDILETGPSGLGFLRASISVGAVLMGLVIIRLPVRRRAGHVLLGSVAVFGLATLVFGVSEWVWLSYAALALAGAADMVSVYIRQTLIQLATPDHMRGRVSSVTMMFVGASNELGEFRAGTVAAWIGTVASVVVGGLGTVAVAGGWAALFPTLRKVDALEANRLREE